MKVLNTTLVLASVFALSSANAADSAQMQQPSADAPTVNSRSFEQNTEVQKDSKGAIKRKKSTVEEQNLQQQQQAVPSTQQPAAGQ